MKILFLDIDGVIASLNYIRQSSRIRMPHPDEYGYGFDPICVDHLKTILESCPDVKIVLSSSWKSMGLAKVQDMWKIRNVPGEVIDITPDLYVMERGLEIDKWITQHPEITTYCIIDDDSDMMEWQMDKFVHTVAEVGITEEDVKKAIAILNS